MSPTFLSDIHTALQNESIQNDVSGWIFTDFHNRDSFTETLLSLSSDGVSTRRWIYVVLTQGTEIKIQHAIEPHALDSLPATEVYSYSSQNELKAILSSVKDTYGSRFAILADDDISVISTVDAGFVSFLSNCGIQTFSAASLVQRCKGLLSPVQIESQERAGTILYQTIYDAWKLISTCYQENKPVTEYEVQQFILKQFEAHSLITDHAPIVAFGANSGNPHYEPSHTESRIAQEGDVIQMDIWAKENTPYAAYADISWVGYFGKKVPEHIEACWKKLTEARDAVCLLLGDKPVTGAFLDVSVRKILIDAGYGNGLKHRTGHGIDTECHGSGTNLDSVEFPDNRFLLEGSSFSVEPGLYFADFGLRTEIDIYISDGEPVISGKKYNTSQLDIPQKDILTIL